MGSEDEAICCAIAEAKKSIKFRERIRKSSFLIYEVCVIIAITCGKCRNNSKWQGKNKRKENTQHYIILQ